MRWCRAGLGAAVRRHLLSTVVAVVWRGCGLLAGRRRLHSDLVREALGSRARICRPFYSVLSVLLRVLSCISRLRIVHLMMSGAVVQAAAGMTAAMCVTQR